MLNARHTTIGKITFNAISTTFLQLSLRTKLSTTKWNNVSYVGSASQCHFFPCSCAGGRCGCADLTAAALRWLNEFHRRADFSAQIRSMCALRPPILQYFGRQKGAPFPHISSAISAVSGAAGAAGGQRSSEWFPSRTATKRTQPMRRGRHTSSVSSSQPI